MKKYIGILELESDDEIIDANVSYIYSSNGTAYGAGGSVTFKEEKEDAKNKTYEDGLEEAWEYARKIISAGKCDKEMNEVFGDDFYYEGAIKVLTKYTIAEVAEKLKEHEIIKIKIGDEVVDKNEWGIKGVVTKTTERLISIVEEKGNVSRWKKENFEKTGRHFSEIEKVIKQMQEDDE